MELLPHPGHGLMAVGPFSFHTPPGGSGTSSWTWGSDPIPDWALGVMKALCAANVGRMRRQRVSGWIKRYFVRKNREMRKHFNLTEFSTGDWFSGISTRVDETISIHWNGVSRHEFSMPTEMAVPSTLAVLIVHES